MGDFRSNDDIPTDSIPQPIIDITDKNTIAFSKYTTISLLYFLINNMPVKICSTKNVYGIIGIPASKNSKWHINQTAKIVPHIMVVLLELFIREKLGFPDRYIKHITYNKKPIGFIRGSKFTTNDEPRPNTSTKNKNTKKRVEKNFMSL